MMNLIYFFIVVFANIIGSFSGMGGGIIIKPLVSIASHLPLETVLFYSNLSIIVMCFTSFIYSQWKKTTKYGKDALYICLGSLTGGLVGSILLNLGLSSLESIMKELQIALTIITIVAGIWYQCKGKPVQHLWTTPWKIFCIGAIMGAFSILLGIGGGPLNVLLLMMLLGFPLKKATSYSLISVLGSVSIRVIMSFDHIHQIQYQTSTMLVFMGSAFVGAIIGILIKKHLNMKNFKKLYISTLGGVILLNIINLFIG